MMVSTALSLVNAFLSLRSHYVTASLNVPISLMNRTAQVGLIPRTHCSMINVLTNALLKVYIDAALKNNEALTGCVYVGE